MLDAKSVVITLEKLNSKVLVPAVELVVATTDITVSVVEVPFAYVSLYFDVDELLKVIDDGNEIVIYPLALNLLLILYVMVYSAYAKLVVLFLVMVKSFDPIIRAEAVT